MTDSNVERKNHFELFNDHERAHRRKASILAHSRGDYIIRHPHFWCCVNLERKIYRHSTREDEIIFGIISLPCTQNKTDMRWWVIYNHESSTDTLRYLQLRLFVLFLLGVGWLGLVSCVYIYFPKHWHSNRHEGDSVWLHGAQDHWWKREGMLMHSPKNAKRLLWMVCANRWLPVSRKRLKQRHNDMVLKVMALKIMTSTNGHDQYMDME